MADTKQQPDAPRAGFDALVDEAKRQLSTLVQSEADEPRLVDAAPFVVQAPFLRIKLQEATGMLDATQEKLDAHIRNLPEAAREHKRAQFYRKDMDNLQRELEYRRSKITEASFELHRWFPARPSSGLHRDLWQGPDRLQLLDLVDHLEIVKHLTAEYSEAEKYFRAVVADIEDEYDRFLAAPRVDIEQ